MSVFSLFLFSFFKYDIVIFLLGHFDVISFETKIAQGKHSESKLEIKK